MLSTTYYAQNYAGIIDLGLAWLFDWDEIHNIIAIAIPYKCVM